MNEKYWSNFDPATGCWAIFTPDGDELCQVFEHEVEPLLSHLNRG